MRVVSLVDFLAYAKEKGEWKKVTIYLLDESAYEVDIETLRILSHDLIGIDYDGDLRVIPVSSIVDVLLEKEVD